MNREDYLRQAELCEAEALKQSAPTMRRQFEFLARQMRDFAEKIERIQQSRPGALSK